MTGLQRFTLLCFIVAASFLIFVNATYAYDVPQDAVIKVFDANGKQIGEMSRSEYKVVKLNTSKAPTVNLNVTKVIYKQPEVKRNRLTVKFGVGSVGTEQRYVGNAWEVSEKIQPVAGLGYSYMFENNFSLGVSGLFNDDAEFGVGTADLGYNF